DSVGELAKMRADGKIRHVGLSNITIEQLAQAQKIVPIVTVQNHYNLASRESERMSAQQSEEMIDICERQGIGFIPWNPLAAGELARPGGPLDQIAKRHNAKPSQIALAWLLKRSSTMLPIPGTSSDRQHGTGAFEKPGQCNLAGLSIMPLCDLVKRSSRARKLSSCQWIPGDKANTLALTNIDHLFGLLRRHPLRLT